MAAGSKHAKIRPQTAYSEQDEIFRIFLLGHCRRSGHPSSINQHGEWQQIGVTMQSALLMNSDTMCLKLLQVRNCDCVRPDGPCGCDPPHAVRNVQLQELDQTSTRCADGELPCDESPPSTSEHCLCLGGGDDAILRLCACNAAGGGKGKAQTKREEMERSVLHCMCLIDQPDGTVKPCGCNQSTDFLGMIRPLEDGVAVKG